jgi:histidine triad (HIT) family protein
MSSIFTKIINGEIPCHKIEENEDYIAFLDVFPLQKGHTLVIPKKETDYIFNVEDEELAGLMIFAKRMAQGIKKAYPCKRIGVTVIGLEVPHAHIHLIPINKERDISFTQDRLKFSEEEYEEIANNIKAAL